MYTKFLMNFFLQEIVFLCVTLSWLKVPVTLFVDVVAGTGFDTVDNYE